VTNCVVHDQDSQHIRRAIRSEIGVLFGVAASAENKKAA
jgi:hypothetical protein